MTTKGVIVTAPSNYSPFGRVRSEYGEEYSVHATELPEGANDGDNLAYHVDIWQNSSGNATTLREGAYPKR